MYEPYILALPSVQFPVFNPLYLPGNLLKLISPNPNSVRIGNPCLSVDVLLAVVYVERCVGSFGAAA